MASIQFSSISMAGLVPGANRRPYWKNADHQRPSLDLFHEPFEHIGGLHIVVMLAR
jgi:hypothetical protein